eukprot:scaffold133690_cov32-Tisochrysis_lutea.AAC.2
MDTDSRQASRERTTLPAVSSIFQTSYMMQEPSHSLAELDLLSLALAQSLQICRPCSPRTHKHSFSKRVTSLDASSRSSDASYEADPKRSQVCAITQRGRGHVQRRVRACASTAHKAAAPSSEYTKSEPTIQSEEYRRLSPPQLGWLSLFKLLDSSSCLQQ